MATFLKAVGTGSLSLKDDINDLYGLGNDLSDYRGVRWYKADATTGVFSDPMQISEFYSTGPESPVTPGSQTFTSSGTFTVPDVYATLTVTIRGGAGGGAGGSGYDFLSNIDRLGNAGSPGGASSFGAYGSADFGRGGQPKSVNGADGSGSTGTPAGGAGGAIPSFPSISATYAGGRGGHGGYAQIVLTNPAGGGTGPAFGSSVTVTVGSGGAGGAPGFNYYPWLAPYFWYGTAGSAGAAGSVTIAWA